MSKNNWEKHNITRDEENKKIKEENNKQKRKLLHSLDNIFYKTNYKEMSTSKYYYTYSKIAELKHFNIDKAKKILTKELGEIIALRILDDFAGIY